MGRRVSLVGVAGRVAGAKERTLLGSLTEAEGRVLLGQRCDLLGLSGESFRGRGTC